MAVHIAIALAAVVVGIAAMFATKRRGRHSTFGSIYLWLLGAVFVTATVLSVMRWNRNRHLFVLGTLAFGFAILGKVFARAATVSSLRVHASAMGASYIVMLTAFYVDNGKNLPLWKGLPPITYWTVPALFGLPLIAWVLHRHPLLRSRTDRP